MRPTTDSSSIKVHTDSAGNVWYLAGDGQPKPAGTKLNRFLESKLVRDFGAIRLVGARRNVKTIVESYFVKITGKLDSIQLCSPQICPTDVQNSPEAALRAMRRWDGRPASIGGWHEMTENDYVSYMLAHKLQTAKTCNDDIRRLAKDHIAWPALSFIPTINRDAAIQLLCTLLDPRWYIDPDKPDKGARIESFLGLHPKTQRGVSGDGPRWRLHNLCELVMRCWKPVDLVPYSPGTMENPRNFVLRVWQHHGKGYLGDLRASQYFINYLRLTWISGLYGKRTGEALFVPEYFFGPRDESSAFNAFMANYNGCST